MSPYSVILPCYNCAGWLDRCLDSVFAAASPGAQIIAVDDGSADATGAMLRARSGIVALCQEHRGVSAARNRGLDAADGRFVFFIDPDDEVEKDFFEAMCEKMEHADYCICAMRNIDDATHEKSIDPLKSDWSFGDNGHILDNYLPRIFGYSIDDIRAWGAGRTLFSGREMASVCRAAFRRGLIERHKIRFDESVELYEDMVFNARYLLHAQSMASIPRALYIVHSRADSAMATIPGDARRKARNKLALLAARNAIDAEAGGLLRPLYAGSCVLSALEILAAAVKHPFAARECIGALRRYLADDTVRSAFANFPFIPGKVAVSALAVLLRIAAGIKRVPSAMRD